MADNQALSGDVQGFAPTRPADSSAPISMVGGGKMPKAKVSLAPAPEPAAQESPPPPTVSASSNNEDVPGNPFTGAESPQDRAPASTDGSSDGGDVEGNPFAPSSAPVNSSAMKSVIDSNLQAHTAQNPLPAQQVDTLAPKDPIHDFVGGLEAGLQFSVSGLGVRGKMPTTILPEQADMAMRIGKQIGQFAGDLPAMLPGLVSAGVEAAAAPATGGLSLAGMAASSAEAFALPAALRKVMIDHYEKGDITTSKDFAARTMATAWEAIKGGTTGAATAAAGGLAAPVAGKLAGMGAELAAMTTVGSALEGHLPSAQDFLDGAITIGGLHSIGKLGGSFAEGMTDSKLRNIYAETGETPQQVVERAQKDVELKQQIVAGNAQEPPQATPTNINHEIIKEEMPKEGEKPAVIGTKTETIPKTAEELGIDPPVKNPSADIPRSDAENEVLSKIGERGEPTGKTLKDRWDDFYAKNIDYLDPINSAIKEAVKNGAVITDGAYDLGRLLAAHMDKTRSFLEFGTRDAETGTINGEGLNNILKSIPDNDVDGFRAYVMAKRAIELDGRGIKPWDNFDKVGAEKVVESNDRFEPIHQRLIGFTNRVLDYAQDKGLFSADQIDAMKEANQSYIPFNRAFEADEFTGTVKSGSAIKKILGSDKEIVDPILQTYKNTEMIIKKALVNEVRATFTDNLDAGGLLGKGIPGEDLSNKYLNKVSASGLLADNQIAVFKDGVREVYEGSPGVIDSLKRLDGDKTMMDLTTKVLRGFSNATRLGVVSDPTFGFAHFFRSQIMSGIYSKTGMIPFLHPALSLADFMGKSDTYQQWLYDGGATGSLFTLNETYMKDKAFIEANEKPSYMDRAWNVIKAPMQASEAFIKLTDNLSRFTEYKRALEQGKGNIESAMLSRNVVPDYAQVGLQRSVLRTGVAFIGAHINSLDRMGRELEADPKGFMMKMSVLTGMSAALWAVNKDDEAIEAIPDWQKNTYWNINISKFSKNYQPDNATILRLPKPWSPGILFGSGAEVALDSYFKDKPREFPHFMENLSKSVLPELMPNMLQPVMDQYSNKQAFSGRPLVPEYKQKLLPELQYSPYTSETAKAIGKLIGYVPLVKDLGPSTDPLASPAVVENYIKAWSGTIGGWALKTSDWAMRGFTPDIKATPWEDTPILHRFVSHFPSFQDQRLQDFYENKDESDKYYNSYKAEAKVGNFDAAEAIAKAHPDFQVRLDSIGKGISTARKAYQNIQEDPNIPSTEKEQNLHTILFQIGSMAKEGNQMMSDFRKNMGDNKTAER